MSSVYTPSTTSNPTSYTQPSDGDNANAASVLTMMQALADKSSFLGGMWKPYVIATGTTVNTPTMTTTTSVLGYAYFALGNLGTSLLTTDIVVLMGTLGMYGSATQTVALQGYLQSGAGTVNLDSATLNTDTFSAPTPTPYFWAGNLGSALTLSGSLNAQIRGATTAGTVTLSYIRMMCMILRQG